MSKSPSNERFNTTFYQRFYGSKGNAVATGESAKRLANFVNAYMRYLNVPLRNVLDVGCGTGLWRRALRRIDRSIEYRGIEVSHYLCRKYGWQKESIVDFRSRRKFDLVVCQGVLQYLDRNEARTAVDNLARFCRGALYLEVYTREDHDEDTCDPRFTDDDVYIRSARWYRSLLAPHFISCGGGLHVPANSPTVLFEMEKGR